VFDISRIPIADRPTLNEHAVLLAKAFGPPRG
jgi:hypothetical protein